MAHYFSKTSMSTGNIDDSTATNPTSNQSDALRFKIIEKPQYISLQDATNVPKNTNSTGDSSEIELDPEVDAKLMEHNFRFLSSI